MCVLVCNVNIRSQTGGQIPSGDNIWHLDIFVIFIIINIWYRYLKHYVKLKAISYTTFFLDKNIKPDAHQGSRQNIAFVCFFFLSWFENTLFCL